MTRAAASTGARGEASESPTSSLEYGTKLVRPREGHWSFVLYPGAAEGGGSFRSAGLGSGPDQSFVADADRSASDAVRRARPKVRRFCADNRLNRLGTLTYGPPFCRDPQQLRRDIGEFFRRLRAEAGEPFAYLWVPERHADGERFHVHF